MSVLVIGGSGYLGAAIVSACQRRGLDTLVLSRQGGSGLSHEVKGDVLRPGLGLSITDADLVRAEVTEVVLTFGSVDWGLSPAQAQAIHASGTANTLAFLRGLPSLRQAVHISSLLVLGDSEQRVSNRDLFVGQRFRNWYEYGKYRAERQVRDASDLPIGSVRFGPIIGSDPLGRPISVTHGLLAALPTLVGGWPVHLDEGGEFDSWVTDVASAAKVVVTALTEPIGRETWTWYDPERPTMRQVLTDMCRGWGTVPRIIDAPSLRRVNRWLAPRIGLPAELLPYCAPWLSLHADVLDSVPQPWPIPDRDYAFATGASARTGPASTAAPQARCRR